MFHDHNVRHASVLGSERLKRPEVMQRGVVEAVVEGFFELAEAFQAVLGGGFAHELLVLGAEVITRIGLERAAGDGLGQMVVNRADDEVALGGDLFGLRPWR
jgi:hypothetical protein